MSFERFAWLLSPRGHVPEGRASLQDVEAACSFATRSCWRVFPAIHPKLVAWGKRQRSHSAPLAELEAWNESIRIYAQVQSRHVLRIAREFSRRHIPYVLLKGSALKWFAYENPWERTGWDIDVAVPPRHLEAAQAVAMEQGFLPAEGFKDPPWFRPANPYMRAQVEANHHELGFLVRRIKLNGLPPQQEAHIRRQAELGRTGWELGKDGELTGYVTIDIHHGLSQEIPVEPVIESAVSVQAEGMQVRVPDPAWALLHLVFKLYWEGVHNYSKGGYQFADVCRLVPLLDDAATAKFESLLARWNLEAAAYFVLRRLEPEFGLKLSHAMHALLKAAATPKPDLEPTQQNDLGDMWPKLWGGR